MSNFDDLKNIISARLESLQEVVMEDVELAATQIATGIALAYATGDQDSAEELVDQLELLGEIQRLRLRAESLEALRDSLKFGIGMLFAMIP